MKTRCCVVVLTVGMLASGAGGADSPVETLKRIDLKRGIVCVAGHPPEFVVDLAKKSEIQWFVPVAGEARPFFDAAEEAGLLGARIVISPLGADGRIALAENVADAVVLGPEAPEITDAELSRVLRPLGRVWRGTDEKAALTKPVPEGYEDWSHPFHGPDNNPQSRDIYARGKFRTQFLAEPKFSPMPEQSVIGGGRIYKALGHIAHKANQNEMLNTLLCVNAYNGTNLWRRPLPEGFMIHRNTMIATDDALLMGDDKSCKVIDGATGEIRREITVPAGISDGPVWKWMGLRDGVLYALLGNAEVKVDTVKSMRRGLGHWPWDMWQGHEYADPELSFGYGRTLAAFDVTSGEKKWHYRDPEFLDARALTMNAKGQIFAYAPEKFLIAIDSKDGSVQWRTKNADLLAALGPNAKAQHYMTGYATTSYMKCDNERIFFAGPQRTQMVVAAANDGGLLWTHEEGNLQLVLREDAVWAAGPQNTFGRKLAYASGSVLEQFPARRACTRATGGVDSIFYRASGGTVRVFTETNTAHHIAPMRPPCQDGVLISNGHLYWGPWMCGCQLSLYGNIALAPRAAPGHSGDLPDADTAFATALTKGKGTEVPAFPIDAKDWSHYQGNEARNSVSRAEIPATIAKKWSMKATTGDDMATAPVAAGGRVFVADRAGVVRALEAETGKLAWKAHTSGPVYFPPAVADDRVFVGSADGRVHAFSAATGEALWSFRVGPRDQMIPVFGKLISLWPLSGGVVVKDGTVYAAGGITHYDGTWVVALDAKTGAVKAHNTTSGTIAAEVDNGISVQGELMITDGELRFLGGGVYEWARYDLATLKNVNDPKVQVHSEFRTAFYPYYPEYGKYVSLEHTCGDGRVLNHDANYEGLYFTNLSLLDRPSGQKKDAAGEFIRSQLNRRGKGDENPGQAKAIWEDKTNRRFTSFIVAAKGDRLLAAGHIDEKPEESFVALIDVASGADIWLEKLPSVPVKGGTAIDAAGRVLVVMENGEMRCFGPK